MATVMFWTGILTPPVVVLLVFATLLLIGREQDKKETSSQEPLSHPVRTSRDA
jgi:hypothetical protein